MANQVKNIAPSPEVQYLPAIFRRIQAGDIRMPAFQRGFVWERKQIVELLESIYQGFPIGSLLLWKTNKSELNIEDPTKSNFPQVPERFPVSYILDGLQRLSTLYAVFHFDRAMHDEKFSVGFDLRSKEFSAAGSEKDVILPLNVLFKPTSFIQYHSALQNRSNSSELIQNAVDLLSTFQEYLLPIVTIEGRAPDEVVQIFERINSTGSRLGAVDFMRAVTWSERFDLNRELDKLQELAAKDGFDIPDETLIRILAIALGYSTTSGSMLQMRKLSSKALGRGVTTALKLLRQTLRFFITELGVTGYDLVPYEGQLLAVAGFYTAPNQPSSAEKVQLARWFWTSSLNEDLQGRSENRVARIVDSMKEVRAGKSELRGKLALTSATLKERRFRWGAAISSALAAMFAKNSARSLISGEIIKSSDFLGADASSAFISLADDSKVAAAMGQDIRSTKVLANTIVTAKSERAQFLELGVEKVISNVLSRSNSSQILASQFISESALDALRAGEISEFLERRAQSILSFASTLTFPNTGSS